ncbi:dunce, isoform G [Reticulomyxa filosa]|uniref:Dunce, isoform G n=1 Tax=Reticulomyxa filosa TaxID=46433 RepID=X6NLB2_RETFI|nr:dunce, isoform G [Reticulomyxa filosa]|eukprot:ETO26776.1 dunce, isoform G [Reticulomyxa filosa]
MFRSAATTDINNNEMDLYDKLCLAPLYRLADCPPLADLSQIENDGFLLLHPNQAIVEDVVCENPPLRVDGILNERFFLLEIVVHLADVSNPAKPLNIAKMWARRVMDEFYCQGDKEREFGIPVTPMMDRHSSTAQIAKVQIGFLQFVIIPFFESFTSLCVDAKECFDTLQSNLEYWKSIHKEPPTTNLTSNASQESDVSNALSNEKTEEVSIASTVEDVSKDKSKTKNKTKHKERKNPRITSREPKLKSIEEEKDDAAATDIENHESDNKDGMEIKQKFTIVEEIHIDNKSQQRKSIQKSQMLNRT